VTFSNTRQKTFTLLPALALCCAILTSITHAQSGTASIGGTVFDEQGKVIAGATVTLVDVEKGFLRAASTNEGGFFVFPSIQPGVYRLQVEMTGFKKLIRSDIRALVDTPAELSVVLEVGSISETVNVDSGGAGALLNTQDATIGSPFGADQVTQLPTEARDVINLLTLQPGVTRFGFVAGGRSDQANITLDGVDVNEAQTNNIFSPVLRLNAEAIEEFRVTTTNPNADQGRSSGAQVSLVTKGGTNQLRGAIFLTGRRTGWTANDFFNNRAGVVRPKLDRNVFGGAVGGPIWRDRAFFFYSYEGERTTRGDTALRTVPLPNLGQGILRFRNDLGAEASLGCQDIATVFPNTNGCNPLALTVFAAAAARYPTNSIEVGDRRNTAGFRFNSDNRITNNSHVLRFDLNVTAKQQLFARFNSISDSASSPPRFPDTPAPSVWKHPTGLAIGHSWTIAPAVFNSFRFGLTRDAFTNQGDSTDNEIIFPGVYVPRMFRRNLSRVTPVLTISDDISWIRQAHTLQFGANIRLIRNRQQDFAASYDYASTLAVAFPVGSVLGPINSYLFSTLGYRISGQSLQAAVTAVIGRYSEYDANFIFSRDGALQPSGTPSEREFRTEEYDLYAQDIWKLRPNLTVTAGLRYGLSRPVYEASGYEVKPNISLSEIFERRRDGAASGTPYNQPIVVDLSGPTNGKSPLYRWDKNNFQPRIAAAWSPQFGKGLLGMLLGRKNGSVIRGGFAITNDYFGQQLAVGFDTNNTLGFSTSLQIPTNTYNLTTNIGPRFTGFGQDIRGLPNIALPTGNLTFPRQAAVQTTGGAPIEAGFDEDLTAPINYSWSLTYERTLPLGLIVSASYLGRKARNLLQPRDAAQIANFVDTASGTDWNTAATRLEVLRQQNTPVTQIEQIPYFANLFPANLSTLLGCDPSYNQTRAVYSLVFTGVGSCEGTDWTTAQLYLSLLSSRFPGQHIFYQPQYGVYRAWSSIGRSDYQGLTLTVRQRLGTRLTADLNYTLSTSKDEGSGLQSANIHGPSAIVNPFRQSDMYAASDFDMRHIVNANGVLRLPFGRGEPIFAGAGRFADLLVGGWQLTGIFRYNSGLPISAPLDSGWATNWSVRSYTTRTADIKACPTRGGSLFGCNPDESYRGFRNAYPGETGERNVLRLPSYWVLDIGAGKTFDLPWERHKLQFRWEIFNLANAQKMGVVANYVVEPNPQSATQAPANFASFTSIQGQPRSMQFVLRYSF